MWPRSQRVLRASRRERAVEGVCLAPGALVYEELRFPRSRDVGPLLYQAAALPALPVAVVVAVAAAGLLARLAEAHEVGLVVPGAGACGRVLVARLADVPQAHVALLEADARLGAALRAHAAPGAHLGIGCGWGQGEVRVRVRVRARARARVRAGAGVRARARVRIRVRIRVRGMG